MSNTELSAALAKVLPTSSPIDTDAVAMPRYLRILESAKVAIRSKVKTKAGGTFELLGAVRVVERFERATTDSRVLLVYRAAADAMHPHAIHLCETSTVSEGSLASAFAAFKLTA